MTVMCAITRIQEMRRSRLHVVSLATTGYWDVIICTASSFLHCFKTRKIIASVAKIRERGGERGRGERGERWGEGEVS